MVLGLCVASHHCQPRALASPGQSLSAAPAAPSLLGTASLELVLLLREHLPSDGPWLELGRQTRDGMLGLAPLIFLSLPGWLGSGEGLWEGQDWVCRLT